MAHKLLSECEDGWEFDTPSGRIKIETGGDHFIVLQFTVPICNAWHRVLQEDGTVISRMLVSSNENLRIGYTSHIGILFRKSHITLDSDLFNGDTIGCSVGDLPFSLALKLHTVQSSRSNDIINKTFAVCVHTICATPAGGRLRRIIEASRYAVDRSTRRYLSINEPHESLDESRLQSTINFLCYHNGAEQIDYGWIVAIKNPSETLGHTHLRTERVDRPMRLIVGTMAQCSHVITADFDDIDWPETIKLNNESIWFPPPFNRLGYCFQIEELANFIDRTAAPVSISQQPPV